MAARCEHLAEQLEARIAELKEMIEQLTESQWRVVCADEGWPIGFVAYHVSLGLERQAGWIERRVAGGPPSKFDWEGTHTLNAALLRRHGLPSKAVTSAALDRRVTRLARIVRSLTEAELDEMTLLFGDHQRSAEWIVRALALRHIDDHTRSIRAALAAQTAGPPT